MTLPLSYSRLRASLRSALRRGKPAASFCRNRRRFAGAGPPQSALSLGAIDAPSLGAAFLHALRRAAQRRVEWPATSPSTLLMGSGEPRRTGASRAAASRVVARGGFEPPKPLGRQIYSLLRLTASLPRRYRGDPASDRRKHKLRQGKLGALLSVPGVPAKLFGFSPLRRPLRNRVRNPLSAFRLRASAGQVLPSRSHAPAGRVELAKGFEPPTG